MAGESLYSLYQSEEFRKAGKTCIHFRVELFYCSYLVESGSGDAKLELLPARRFVKMARVDRVVEVLREEREAIVEELQRIDRALAVLGDSQHRGPGRPKEPNRPLGRPPGRRANRRRRKFSAATIARMRAAQKARWARVKARGRGSARAAKANAASAGT